jgi:hypothetical protein
VRDLGKAFTGGALGADAVDEVWRKGCGPPRLCRRRPALARGPAPLGDQPLELVGWDQACAPRHFDRLDVREDAAVESRAADAKRLGRLGAGVGEPLDACRLADYRLRLLVAPVLFGATAMPTTRHPYSVHKS